MSKTEQYDVVVVGLGGMGSAALYHLARRGRRVCGVEQYDVAHDQGSSCGEVRIIRKAYFEHPDYIPLLNRSYELWEELEEECGHTLLVKNGLMLSGRPDSEAVQGLEACYAAHNLPHERLEHGDAGKRFKQFTLPEDHIVFYDPLGGYLFVEECVRHHVSLAEAHGATVHLHEDVESWGVDGGGIRMVTDQREIVADKIILTVGAWAVDSLAELGVKLEIVRKAQLWYTSPNIESYRVSEFPCFYIELDYGHFYGFPPLDEYGMKVAEHVGGAVVDGPEHLDRALSAADEGEVLRFIGETFRAMAPKLTRFSPCMYTKSPDEHFIIDKHPDNENVIMATGFSGHGFKFASVVGEILADLALRGETGHRIEFLGLERFRHAHQK